MESDPVTDRRQDASNDSIAVRDIQHTQAVMILEMMNDNDFALAHAILCRFVQKKPVRVG